MNRLAGIEILKSGCNWYDEELFDLYLAICRRAML